MVLKEINTGCEDYHFVEALMHSAFPSDERRDDALQRRNVDCNEKMRCLLIKDGDVNVGFFTVWSLSGIFYIEHFAIAENLRQHGYGTKALSALISSLSSSLILEVELPSTDEAIKRIAFYEKSGFRLSSRPYVQPPYSPEKQSVPMTLMTYGNVDDDCIEKAVEEMYKFVYGYEPKSKTR